MGAAKWGVHLFGDDAMLLWSIHDARAIDPNVPEQLRKESREWLGRNMRPKE